jgi:hypothetical protein
MLNLSKQYSKQNVYEGGDGSLYFGRSATTLAGPADHLLASGLGLRQRDASTKHYRRNSLYLITFLALTLASLSLFVNSMFVVPVVMLGMATIAGGLLTYSSRRAFLSHCAELSAFGFFSHYPEKGITHIRQHKLIAKLGLSSTLVKGRVLTTGFYLARSEKEGHLVVAGYVRCNGDDRYLSMTQSVEDFVRSAFFGKKPQWRLYGEAEQTVYRGLHPRVNTYVKESFARCAPAELCAQIKPFLQKDTPLLRFMLKHNRDLLDGLDNVTELQLRLWCKIQMPHALKRYPLFGKNRLLSCLLRNIRLFHVTRVKIPSVLMVALVNHCVEPSGRKYLEDFSFWLWNLTPVPRLIPQRCDLQNAWMMEAAAIPDLATQRSFLFSGGAEINDAIMYAYKRIIETVGVDQEAHNRSECHLGYRNLFGHDEAMKAFPQAGRTLLTDDMGL